MSWKDFPVIRPDEVAGICAAFSSGCRDCFSLLQDGPRDDILALRGVLYGRAVRKLISECPMSRWSRNVLLDLISRSPDEALSSIAKDARRIGSNEMLKKIDALRRYYSAASFERIMSPRGMGLKELTPASFWVQLGKDGAPYLRMWMGFRSYGVCSHESLPRSFLRTVVSSMRLHERRFPLSLSNYQRMSSLGSTHALAVESSLRFLIPLSESQRSRYIEEANRSDRMDGTRVRRALSLMLSDFIGPLGIEIPFDPKYVAGLIRDASPLDSIIKGF